jgi:hypothetical protein
MKVIASNALLLMLLVCIRSFLERGLRYKFEVSYTCHLDTLSKDVRIRGYFSKPRRGPGTEEIGKHCSRGDKTETLLNFSYSCYTLQKMTTIVFAMAVKLLTL